MASVTGIRRTLGQVFGRAAGCRLGQGLGRSLVPVLLLGLLGAAAVPPLYPIDPVPLRALVQSSDFIVVGTVEGISELPPEPGRWGSTLATVRITSVLKGKLDGPSVSVLFMPGLMCPAPATYTPGQQVLAFLIGPSVENGGHFHTNALSYGTKELDPQAMLIYGQRIWELREIDALEDADAKQIRTQEWLVSLLEHEATRGEGLLDFSIHRPASMQKTPQLALDVSSFPGSLQSRLVSALGSMSPGDDELGSLASLLRPLEDPRLDALLLARFHAMAEGDGATHQAGTVATVLAGRSADAALIELARLIEAGRWAREADELALRLVQIKQFREDYEALSDD